MTHVDTRSTTDGPSTLGTLARAMVAMLLALAGPAVSFLPALTTNIHGSGAAVTYPHGYTVMLVVTVAVTAVACALGAVIARRAALVAIPVGLALWAVIGFALIVVGVTLSHHAHLTGWGIAPSLLGDLPAGRSLPGDLNGAGGRAAKRRIRPVQRPCWRLTARRARGSLTPWVASTTKWS